MRLSLKSFRAARRGFSSSTLGLNNPETSTANSVSPFDYYEEAMQKHRLILQAQPDRMDSSIISQNGRAFDADSQLLDRDRTITFPSVSCTSLLSQQALLPQDCSADVKLLVLSFKHYGFTVVRSWLDPFLTACNQQSSSSSDAKKFAAIELCFFEHRFLSFARGYVGSGVKKLVPVQYHGSTYLSFGNNLEFGTRLLIPNFCTGYAYLLDKHNKIRWRGSGQAKPEEVQRMLQLSRDLAAEKV